MPDILHQAIRHHQQGRFAEAARLYQAILAVQRDHPEALHLLGVVAHQQGDHARAVELIVRALAGNGVNAMVHANLAEVGSTEVTRIEPHRHRERAGPERDKSPVLGFGERKGKGQDWHISD
jgi:tetratricopeptide (TPR) repeat protein